MANFEEAYKRTCRFEGGYSNDKNDSGGETYKGISRKNNPKWSGWSIIDSCKKKSNFPKILDYNDKLQSLVKDCYRSNYWEPISGDKIENQKVANDLYDTAVNMGVATSIKLSQSQFGMKENGRMNDDLLSKLNSVV